MDIFLNFKLVTELLIFFRNCTHSFRGFKRIQSYMQWSLWFSCFQCEWTFIRRSGSICRVNYNTIIFILYLKLPNLSLSIYFIISKKIILVSFANFRYSQGSSALCAGWDSDSCSPFNPGNQTTFYIGVKADPSDSDVRNATVEFTRGNIANLTEVNTTTLSPATLPSISKFWNKHTILEDAYNKLYYFRH